MMDVQELESIYDLPQDAAYYISYGRSLEAAIDAFRNRYYYYPEVIYKVRGNTSLYYFQVEQWDEDKHIPRCPKCTGRLLNDGEAVYPVGGATGVTFRCEHCDYSVDIVE